MKFLIVGLAGIFLSFCINLLSISKIEGTEHLVNQDMIDFAYHYLEESSTYEYKRQVVKVDDVNKANENGVQIYIFDIVLIETVCTKDKPDISNCTIPKDAVLDICVVKVRDIDDKNKEHKMEISGCTNERKVKKSEEKTEGKKAGGAGGNETESGEGKKGGNDTSDAGAGRKVGGNNSEAGEEKKGNDTSAEGKKAGGNDTESGDEKKGNETSAAGKKAGGNETESGEEKKEGEEEDKKEGEGKKVDGEEENKDGDEENEDKKEGEGEEKKEGEDDDKKEGEKAEGGEEKKEDEGEDKKEDEKTEDGEEGEDEKNSTAAA